MPVRDDRSILTVSEERSARAGGRRAPWRTRRGWRRQSRVPTSADRGFASRGRGAPAQPRNTEAPGESGGAARPGAGCRGCLVAGGDAVLDAEAAGAGNGSQPVCHILLHRRSSSAPLRL